MLTVTAINQAKPKDKPYKLADEKGLYLLIQASGSKLWRFDYRFESKRKTLALGAYPDVPLALARDRRDNARKSLANEIDPSETKKAVKATKANSLANSFEVIAREWLDTKMQTKSERYQLNVLRRFELYLFPWIGKRVELHSELTHLTI